MVSAFGFLLALTASFYADASIEFVPLHESNDCIALLEAGEGYHIAQVLKGAGTVWVTTARDFFVSAPLDPQLQKIREALESAEHDERVDKVMREGLHYFRSEMDLSQVSVAFLGPGVIRQNAVASALFDLSQGKVVIVPYGQTIKNAGQWASSTTKRMRLIFDLSAMNARPQFFLTTLLHEITHLADVHRVRRASERLQNWPAYLHAEQGPRGLFYIPEANFQFMLECRAYVAQMRTESNMGLFSRSHYDDQLHAFISNLMVKLNGIPADHPLIQFGILRGQQFDVQRMFEVADQIDQWFERIRRDYYGP